ncbi:unnamed protein product, partial [Onchocerca ochengi]
DVSSPEVPLPATSGIKVEELLTPITLFFRKGTRTRTRTANFCDTHPHIRHETRINALPAAPISQGHIVSLVRSYYYVTMIDFFLDIRLKIEGQGLGVPRSARSYNESN